MRLTTPAFAGAAVALAAAFAWYFRPNAEPPFVPSHEAALPQPTPVASPARVRVPDAETPSADATPPREALAVETRPPTLERAPLPGETPSTPMANLMTDRQRELPPQLADGEREFAAEPIDAAWAPGAEADIFGKFAQVSGLKLIDLHVECRSTMCRVQLMQPSGIQDGARPFNALLEPLDLEPRWMITIKDYTGPIKSVGYLWREGFAPPKPAFTPAHETN
jgi:hypothetical protein